MVGGMVVMVHQSWARLEEMIFDGVGTMLGGCTRVGGMEANGFAIGLVKIGSGEVGRGHNV